MEPVVALLQRRTSVHLLKICASCCVAEFRKWLSIVAAQTVSKVMQAEGDNALIGCCLVCQACGSGANRQTWVQLGGGSGHLEQPSVALKVTW